MLRRVLFWLHLAAGISAGVVILIMSVTGVLLTYEREVIAWADTRSYSVTPAASRLPVDDLLARARTAKGMAPTSIVVRSRSDAPVEFAFGGHGILFVDPYTGAVLGGEARDVRAFFRSVTDWHRWLARPQGESRATGRAVTGAANLAFLFLAVSGLFLWIPRLWTRVQVRNVLWFRRGLPPRARDFNWHNVLGIWSSVPLVIITASAAVISYPWASDLVYRAAGDVPPVRRTAAAPASTPAPRWVATPAPAAEAQLDPLFVRAMGQVNGWRSVSLRLPLTSSDAVFTVDSGDGGQPQKRGTLTLDAATGSTKRWESFASLSAGRRARAWLRFAHTGEVYGWVGQTVAGAASLAAAVLVWTGVALAVRRLAARVARGRSRADVMKKAA